MGEEIEVAYSYSSFDDEHLVAYPSTSKTFWSQAQGTRVRINSSLLKEYIGAYHAMQKIRRKLASVLGSGLLPVDIVCEETLAIDREYDT